MFDFLEIKQDSEVVLFYDSTHPQYNTLADYGWIKKGSDHTLPSHNARGHVNISGAIDIDNLEVITQFPEKVNAGSTLKMLEKLEKAYPCAQKVHIVLDNAASHKAKSIKNYLKESEINLVFLPPHSPNLNLIERLWGYLRRIVLANQHYNSFKEFKEKIKAFFRKLKDKKVELANLMTLEFHELELSAFT